MQSGSNVGFIKSAVPNVTFRCHPPHNRCRRSTAIATHAEYIKLILPEIVGIYGLSRSFVYLGASILVNGQWRRLHATKCIHRQRAYNLLFISHIIAPKHMIGSEITPNRCNHIWLCNRSLDGYTIQLQNGGRPSDVPQCIGLLTVILPIYEVVIFHLMRSLCEFDYSVKTHPGKWHS